MHTSLQLYPIITSHMHPEHKAHTCHGLEPTSWTRRSVLAGGFLRYPVTQKRNINRLCCPRHREAPHASAECRARPANQRTEQGRYHVAEMQIMKQPFFPRVCVCVHVCVCKSSQWKGIKPNNHGGLSTCQVVWLHVNASMEPGTFSSSLYLQLDAAAEPCAAPPSLHLRSIIPAAGFYSLAPAAPGNPAHR